MIYHIFTARPLLDADTARRVNLAKLSWFHQKWTEVPCRDEDLPRMFKENGRAFPYLKDVFNFACDNKLSEDTIVYTNDDIHVATNCCQRIEEMLKQTDALYGYRRDFAKLTGQVPDKDFILGNNYCGSDLCAFRVRWWRRHGLEMGDMILGGEAWDPMYRTLCERTNPGKQCSLRDAICHERHASYWEKAENRYSLQMQKYCLRVAWNWFRARGIDPGVHGIRLV